MSSRQSSSTSRFTRRAPGFLAAVVVFLVLVSILTFPLVFNLGSRLISTTANLNEDTVIPVWYWWYLRENLASIPSEPGLMLHTNSLYAPGGLDIQTHISDPFFLLSLFPLIGIWGFPYDANLYVIMTLVLNGACVYLVLRKFRLDVKASVLGGALVALNPYYLTTAAAGKHEQAVAWFLILFMGVLPDCLLKGGKKRVLLSAVVFLLASIVYWFHGLFLGLFLVLAVCVAVYKAPRKLRWLPVKRALAVLLLFLALALPFLYPFLPIGVSEGKVMGVSSTKVVPFKLPPRSQERTSTLETEADQLRVRSASPASLVKNRVALLALVLIVPLLFLKRKPWLWIVTGITFYVLSLGPYLSIPGLRKQIVMPFSLLYAFVPFASRILNTGRFAAVTCLALAVLAACSYARFSKRFRFSEKTRFVLLLVLLAVALGLGRTGTKIKLHGLLDVPEGLERIKGLQGGVIDVPFFSEAVCSRALRYQMVHGRPLLAGPGANVRYASPDSFKEMMARYPLLQYLSGFGLVGGRSPGDVSLELELLKKKGFRFVIHHKNSDAGPGEVSSQNDYASSRTENENAPSLIRILGMSPIYSDSAVDIYDLKHTCRLSEASERNQDCCCICRTCGRRFKKCSRTTAALF